MTSAQGYAEVIGNPIAHSKSPRIHGFWLDSLGLELAYRATRVSRADMPAFVEDRRADPDWRGCNVTMPLKLDALMLADEASDRAVAAGAANLLLPKDGTVLAGNTDVGAILELLGPRLQQRPDTTITLLGNGGAARAVLVAVRMLGHAQVRIQARDLAEAYKLAVEFALEEEPRRFDAPIGSDGLINATPLGMAGYPPVEIDLSLMPGRAWVLDMVTEPADTALIKAARDRGLDTIDGIALLIEQAAASFMLLFGHEAPREQDLQLMARLRSP
jgi:shikimate dehydrogenase